MFFKKKKFKPTSSVFLHKLKKKGGEIKKNKKGRGVDISLNVYDTHHFMFEEGSDWENEGEWNEEAWIWRVGFLAAGEARKAIVWPALRLKRNHLW